MEIGYEYEKYGEKKLEIPFCFSLADKSKRIARIIVWLNLLCVLCVCLSRSHIQYKDFFLYDEEKSRFS